MTDPRTDSQKAQSDAHGYRAAFRYTSAVGVVLALLIFLLFVWGPAKSPPENPASGEKTLEKTAKPTQQPQTP